METKRCPRCGVAKSLNEFYSDRGSSSGIAGHCKECKRAYSKQYRREWNDEPYHIDHVIPLALAKTPRQVEILCHYSNLCMLTPEDNLNKKAKCRWESFDVIPIGELAYDSPNHTNRDKLYPSRNGY